MIQQLAMNNRVKQQTTTAYRQHILSIFVSINVVLNVQSSGSIPQACLLSPPNCTCVNESSTSCSSGGGYFTNRPRLSAVHPCDGNSCVSCSLAATVDELHDILNSMVAKLNWNCTINSIARRNGTCESGTMMVCCLGNSRKLFSVPSRLPKPHQVFAKAKATLTSQHKSVF